MTTIANATTMPPPMSTGQVAQAANASVAGAPRQASVRPGKGWVLVYLALALLALIPGVMLKFGMDLGETQAGLLLEELRLGLMDVRFGFGLRFWLGVSGATMMGLLLLYPLRKALAKNRFFGSIGGWFHIHHFLGLAAPVLILYHSNFGLGDTNSNVALWAMLCVVASGVVGHFVYGGASAQYYAGKQEAQQPRDAIMATLARLDAMHGAQQNFIDELTSLEKDLLTPRRGVFASIVARLKVEQRHRHLAKSANWLIAKAGDELGFSAAQANRLQNDVGGHLIAYLRIARAAASGSIREQLWARWRLFHLPAFLIMSVAMTLHIVAVWDIDVWGVRATLPVVEASATTDAPSDTSAMERNATTTPVQHKTKLVAATEPRARPRNGAVLPRGKTINDLLAANDPLAAVPARDRQRIQVAPTRVSPVAEARGIASSRIASAMPVVAKKLRHVLLAKPLPARRPRRQTAASPARTAKPLAVAVPKPVRARPRIRRRVSGIAQPAARPPVLLASARAGSRRGAGSFIKKLSGVWVEGPGFDVTYGGNYNGCTKRCLGNAKCVMLEYYRPERKCNLYDKMRPRKSGGSSNVGIRHRRLSGITAKFRN